MGVNGKVNIASRLSSWIKWSGVSQRRLAAQIGVSPGAVTNWIKGDSNPSLRHVEAVAEVIGVPMSRFFGALPRERRPRP
jgi:transcriptional regulator with XRE-family HTH domain